MIEQYTSQLLTNETLIELNTRGHHLYHTNTYLRDIATFMENPENHHFFKTYLSHPETTRNIFYFLELYHQINEYTQTYNLNGFQKLAILERMMRNSTLRHHVSDIISSWMDRHLNALADTHDDIDEDTVDSYKLP